MQDHRPTQQPTAVKTECRLIRVECSFELLRRILQLPDDIQVVGMSNTAQADYGEILLASQTNESIPVVKEGEKIPRGQVLMTSKLIVDTVTIREVEL